MILASVSSVAGRLKTASNSDLPAAIAASIYGFERASCALTSVSMSGTVCCFARSSSALTSECIPTVCADDCSFARANSASISLPAYGAVGCKILPFSCDLGRASSAFSARADSGSTGMYSGTSGFLPAGTAILARTGTIVLKFGGILSRFGSILLKSAIGGIAANAFPLSTGFWRANSADISALAHLGSISCCRRDASAANSRDALGSICGFIIVRSALSEPPFFCTAVTGLASSAAPARKTFVFACPATGSIAAKSAFSLKPGSAACPWDFASGSCATAACSAVNV